MTGEPSPQIAIVGSGPAGCYLAQALLRRLPRAVVTVFDRLAAPFGLIRYGVAADHQHTKTITRQFDRLFQSENVRFAGNTMLGHDITLEALRAQFDAVVLATGLAQDRRLELPGSELPGVLGAGAVTRALNAHPDEVSELPPLGSDVVLIGAGNVALDILRFLVKDQGDYDSSDIADQTLNSYLEDPASRVTLSSRSDAATSKGDPQMLRELAELHRAQYSSPNSISGHTEPSELDRAQSARVAAFDELLSAERAAYPGPQVILRFGLTPVRVLGDRRVEGVEFAAADRLVVIPATSVITAIGFTATGALADLIAQTSEIGRIEQGLYRTGWAKRGPHGAIPENRACAKSVAEEIVTDIVSGSLPVSASKLGFDGLPARVRDMAISYEQWLTLEAHEREIAPPTRIRQKISEHDRMVAIARNKA